MSTRPIDPETPYLSAKSPLVDILQGPLPVVDDNQKVGGALSVVGATKNVKMPIAKLVEQVATFRFYHNLQRNFKEVDIF